MIKATHRKEFLGSIKDSPHIEVIIHPNSDSAGKLIESDDLEKTLTQLRFQSAGDSFPKWSWRDEHVFKYVDSSIEGYYTGRPKCMYRLYESGQFVYYATLEEDEEDFQEQLRVNLEVEDNFKDQMDGFIEFNWNANRIVEYYTLLSRISRLYGDGETYISIAYRNLGCRAISSLDNIRRAGFWNLYYYEEDHEIKTLVPNEAAALEPSAWCIKALRAFCQRYKFDARDNVLQELLAFYRPRA